MYARLALDESTKYPSLRDALLKRFHLTAHGFQQKFRTAKPEPHESAPQFAVRLDNVLTRWVELSKCQKTYEEVKDLLLREQFLMSVDPTLAMFLKERDPHSISEMSEIAEKYCEAHGGFGMQNITRKIPQQNSNFKKTYDQKPPQRPTNFSRSNPSNPSQVSTFRRSITCYNCGKTGHIAKDCRSRPKGITKVANVIASALTDLFGKDDDIHAEQSINQGTSANENNPKDETSVETIACMMTAHNILDHNCAKDGFVTLKCGYEIPIMSVACSDKNPTGMPVTIGYVNKQSVKVLRDTGCSGIVVRRDLVLDNQLTGQIKSYVLADGTIRQAPVAKVNISTPFFVGYSEVLCIDNPVYDLILGNVCGARYPTNPDPNWKPMVDEPQSPTTDMRTGNNIYIETSAVQTRTQSRQMEKPLKKLKVPNVLPEIDQNQIKEAQRSDPSLKKVRDLAQTADLKQNRNGSSSKFFWSKDLLYREFQSPKIDYGQPCIQLVVPSKFRGHVMKIAHESILGGHQGSTKTAEKVLTNFFWPGVHADITRFCRSCDICQRTLPKGKVSKVPLGKMPLIDTPFQRVAIDIIGPIHPISENGNRYILTFVDYATRYPEAVPLRSIETTRVAEAMVQVFTRVGIPKEILTDQFTSQLMT